MKQMTPLTFVGDKHMTQKRNSFGMTGKQPTRNCRCSPPFYPATVAGKPVKFRKLIQVTLSR